MVKCNPVVLTGVRLGERGGVHGERPLSRAVDDRQGLKPQNSPTTLSCSAKRKHSRRAMRNDNGVTASWSVMCERIGKQASTQVYLLDEVPTACPVMNPASIPATVEKTVSMI